MVSFIEHNYAGDSFNLKGAELLLNSMITCWQKGKPGGSKYNILLNISGFTPIRPVSWLKSSKIIKPNELQKFKRVWVMKQGVKYHMGPLEVTNTNSSHPRVV